MTDDRGTAGQPDEFERYVRSAIARSTRVHTVAELIRATGLHPNTIYDLFNRAVKSPGPRTIALIADALEVPIADLWAAWQGLEPPPDTMQEALRRHTEAIAEQNRLLGELVGYIRRAALGVTETAIPPEIEEQRREARRRAASLSREGTAPIRPVHPLEER